ncbi:MAG: DUF1015 domain-containing protein [Myxococcota bacterium]
MTEVRPFSALRFRGPLGPRLAPPYDVISEEERAGYAKEPENIVHLTLPPGPEGTRDYEGAAETLRGWIAEGTFVRDTGPRLYVLAEHTREGPTRRGLLALVRLADYAEGTVLPHERTLRGPKEDRLRLTRAVRANLEPLFFLYADRERALDRAVDAITAGEPVVRASAPGGVRIDLFETTQAEVIDAFRTSLSSQKLVIADGHHRYETMLRYRDECREASGADRDAPHEFVLGYLVNALDPGTQVRAIHRVAQVEAKALLGRATEAGFTAESLRHDDVNLVLAALSSRIRTEHAFGMIAPGTLTILQRPRGSKLDVEVLHEDLLLDVPVRFDAEADRVARAARAGEGVGLLLNPIDPEDLFRVVASGRLLPQKSTYFSPKIPSGLVVRDFVA